MNVILILLILGIAFSHAEEFDDLVKRIRTLEAKNEVLQARVNQNDCCQNITEIVEKLSEHESKITLNGQDVVDLRTIQGHHSDQIMQLDTDIRSAKEELSNAIEDAITYVDANSEVLEDFLDVRMAPIGTIVGWTPKPNQDSKTFVDIPTGWQLCDGSQIKSGPWIGEMTPDLTADGGRFLRGGTADTVLEYENDQMQDHMHVDPGHSHSDAGHSHDQDPHKHL